MALLIKILMYSLHSQAELQIQLEVLREQHQSELESSHTTLNDSPTEESEIARLNQFLDELRNQVQQRDNDVEEKERLLHERDNDVKERERLLRERDDEISKRNSEIEERRREISILKEDFRREREEEMEQTEKEKMTEMQRFEGHCPIDHCVVVSIGYTHTCSSFPSSPYCLLCQFFKRPFILHSLASVINII